MCVVDWASEHLSEGSRSVPGMCLAQPMLTTSSLSARSHSVVRALMSLSGTVGSGMAKMPSGSATSSRDTTLFSTTPPAETWRDRERAFDCYENFNLIRSPLQETLGHINRVKMDNHNGTSLKKRPKIKD